MLQTQGSQLRNRKKLASFMERKKMRIVIIMKYLYLIGLQLFLVLSCILYAEETASKSFIRIEVDQAEESLLSEAEIFNDRLGSLNKEDIIYVSKRLQDVKEGKYGSPQAARFAVYGIPKMLLISKLNIPNRSGFDFLVCSIYPYKNFSGLGVGETKDLRWIQGHRRFDVWSKSEGIWKVKLEVNMNNLKEVFNHFDSSIVLSDTTDDAVLAIDRIKKSELETNEILERKMLEELRKTD
jgi:hypothetical protein